MRTHTTTARPRRTLRPITTNTRPIPRSPHQHSLQPAQHPASHPRHGEEYIVATHAVDPQRLQPGEWCHESERCIGEGDIYGSYSGDRIGMQGTVRKPFRFHNQLWITTSICGNRTNFIIEAYRLVPLQQFDGKAQTYHEKTRDGEAARSDPMGFYHGMRVKHGGKDWVLCGPQAGFVPGQEAQPDLFGSLERGGR